MGNICKMWTTEMGGKINSQIKKNNVYCYG